MKKTIVHVIDSLGIGGAEILLRTSLSVLPQFRHVVCYLTPPHDLANCLEAEKVYFLDFRTNFDVFKCAYKLRKIISDEQAVLVHAHLLRSTWFSRLAAWRKVPLLFTIHNFLSEDAFKVNRMSYYMEKNTYKKRQAIIYVSKAALNDYDRWIGVKGRSYILYNLVEDAFFDTAKSYKIEKEEETRLIAIGNLRRQKNYMNLLKAFMHLKNERVSLDIYGNGSLHDQLQSFISHHQLPVYLKGQEKNMSGILQNYHGFIMPSSFEGYGIAAMEAMAIGVPVLLSDLEVFREITNDQALFFNQDDPVQIAEAIKRFIRMPQEERVCISNEEKKRAKDIATKENFTSSLLQIYESEINS